MTRATFVDRKRPSVRPAVVPAEWVRCSGDVTAGYRPDDLAVAVIRLLAIALNVSSSAGTTRATSPPPIPEGLIAWPSLESQVVSGGRQATIRFHVSPISFGSTGAAPFPVGTTFVVETIRPGTCADRSALHPGEASTVTHFVMTKCADVNGGAEGEKKRDVWVFGHHEGDGADPDRVLCGVCRLPVTDRLRSERP